MREREVEKEMENGKWPIKHCDKREEKKGESDEVKT